MADFKCSGNCLNCQPAQRAYCASQHAYSNMKVLDTMMGVVLGMKEELIVVKEKIEAIQNNEADIFDPNEKLSSNPSRVEDIAQKGDGAEKRDPKEQTI